MATYNVKQGNTFADIAVITTGNPDNATPIAAYNGYSPSDIAAPGSAIAIPEGLPSDVRTVNFFAAFGNPATDPHILPEGERATYGTIGDMTIGVNFSIEQPNI